MQSKRIKQIKIISVIVIPIACIIGTYLWFNKEDPPTPPVIDKPQYPEIEIQKSQLIQNRDKWDYLAFMENKNTDWALKRVKYKVLLNDKTIESGEEYLNPAPEQKPLIIKGLTLPPENAKVENIELKFYDFEWTKVDRTDLVGNTDLQISPADYSTEETIVPEGSRLHLTSRVRNNTPHQLAAIDIYILVKPSKDSDEIVAVSRSQAQNVKPAELRQFEIFWTNSLANKNMYFARIPSSNFYRDANIISRAGSSRMVK